MVEFRLGLDIGTNSIGWALLSLDAQGDPSSIAASGVRIFTDGRDPKSLASLKADRRVARQARRRRDRYKQRRQFLLSELVRHGLMPEDDGARRSLVTLDPYDLRKRALDGPLPPHHVGRAFFHLNQRRGFKSNRKSADNEAGVVKASIAELRQQLCDAGARTFGEFLADRHKSGESVRARRNGAKKTDLYDFYPSREMLENEFDAIWSAQARFDPKIFDAKAREKLRSVIFHQRKLKPQPVGWCTLVKDAKRAPKALPSFQRFRILQEVNNLEWIDDMGNGHPIRNHPEIRDQIVSALERSQKRTFKQIAGILKKAGLARSDTQFNLQSELRRHLDGNLTSHKLANKRLFGERWHRLGLAEQDEIVTLMLDDEQEDEDVLSALTSRWDLDEERAEAVLNATLPDSYANLSAEAISKIIPPMAVQGLRYPDAVLEAGYDSHSLFGWTDDLLDRLPYYGEVIPGHVIGAALNPDGTEVERHGAIPNPTVHIALNQLRRVYNDIVRIHGKPAQISLEVARDLPLGAEGKRDLERHYKKNQERNDHAREIVKRHGQIDNRANRQRVLLWEELNEDPTQRRCPFSGVQITLSDLFGSNIEIEHLLPFSRTLDDSLSNKTLCALKANRDKGNRTPFEAFGDSPDGYVWEGILERASGLPYGKRWRFWPDAMQRFEGENDFLARQLNDTRYIARIAREYLECVLEKSSIWVVTGRLTALLRGFWGLNSVLRGHNLEEAGTRARKPRDDHRHHAVDAVVIGMTNRSMLQKVSREARRAEDMDLTRLFPDSIDPWDGFRDAVKESMSQIVISHRRRRKDQGQLHNETAYGVVESPNGKGPSTVVHRVGVENIKNRKTVEAIRGGDIRESLLREIDGAPEKDITGIVATWCARRGIRRLRIVEKLSVVPVRDKNGKVYKAYKGDSNAYYDIYRNPKTGKWEGEIVSTYAANQKDFIPEWRKEHPTAKLVMRIRRQDMIELDLGAQRQIMRVQKISRGIVTLAGHAEGNVDQRNRDPDDDFKFTYRSPSALEKAKAVFVHISPAGLIARRNRGTGAAC